MKINKILGKRGRITIPYELRVAMGFNYNDVVSFEKQDDKTILVRREKICNDCRNLNTKPVEAKKPTNEITLMDFLDDLSPAEQRAALVHLSVKWAQMQGGGKNA